MTHFATVRRLDSLDLLAAQEKARRLGMPGIDEATVGEILAAYPADAHVHVHVAVGTGSCLANDAVLALVFLGCVYALADGPQEDDSAPVVDLTTGTKFLAMAFDSETWDGLSKLRVNPAVEERARVEMTGWFAKLAESAA